MEGTTVEATVEGEAVTTAVEAEAEVRAPEEEEAPVLEIEAGSVPVAELASVGAEGGAALTGRAWRLSHAICVILKKFRARLWYCFWPEGRGGEGRRGDEGAYR